jgi:Ca-activated chloride channel family protein
MMLARLWMLNFLWFLPLVVLGLIVQNRKKKKAMERFADPELLERLTVKDHRGRRFLKGILLLFTLGLLIFALAGPRWGSSYQEVSQKGVDIMILVDVSPSMLVEDIKPNRLEQARREIIDFLRVVEGDRVGLVAFAGAAFVQCPLTLDYAALQLFLNALETGLIPVSGTDLSAAIETGLSAFDFESATDKVMLLITDGEDNEGRGVDAARRADEKDVKIFVFGIGELSGGPIPDQEGKGGFKKDEGGKLILSKLDEDGLKAIAANTGGRYVRSMAGDLDLDIIYFDGIKSMTQAQTLKSGKIKIYDERFTFFVIAALLLLLLEGFMDEKKKGTARSLSVILSILVITYGALADTPAFAAGEDPDELYRQGRFAEAETAYARHDMDHPKDTRYRYNRGCSAYQNSDYKGAMAAFSSVLRRTEDNQIRFKAAFNLGNTAYKMGDFESAATYYRQALLADPSNEDARYNMELALRAREKQKEEQNEKPKTEHEKENQKGQESENRQEPKEKNEEKSDPTKKQDKADEKKNGNRSENNQKTEEKPPEDLSGELKPLQELPQENKKDAPDSDKDKNDGASVDRRRAEALLDNIKEDPSRLMQYLIPEEKRHGVSSGKDW